MTKSQKCKFDDDSVKDIEFELEPEPRPPSRCPDGGWGWVIVFAAFICNVIVDGICFTFGIFVPYINDHYNAGHPKTSLVGSVLVGCYLLAGPFGGALANRFGCRKVTIMGSILAAGGFLLSMVSPTIDILIVTYGILSGVGLGLIYLPANVLIGYWFERKRAFATGIALCGSGIGSLIFAPLNKYLLEEYHWKQCLVLLAGIVLQCVVCGALFRPIHKTDQHKRMKRGIVQRGSIMKALIREKERQRTISNGSLDNCIITRDNKLIKIDRIDLRNKSNSYLNKLKEQLGFSSRSLNRSKNSLIITDSKPQTPTQETTPRKKRMRDFERRRDSGCGSLDSPPNAQQSYHTLPQEDPWDKLSRSLSVRSTSSNPSGGQNEMCYTVRDSNGNVQSSNNHLLPPNLINNTGSVLTVPSQFNASVRTINTEYYEDDGAGMMPRWFQSLNTIFDLSLLKNKAFLLYAVTSFLSMLGFFIPFFYLPERIKGLKLSTPGSDPASIILALIGLSNTVGRILVGWIADRPWGDPVCINNISLLVAGVITGLCPYCTTQNHMILFAIGFGLFSPAFLALRSIVLVDLMGLSRLTSSFGMLILFQGVASIAGSPLAGWLMDKTGHIDYVFYMAGSLLAIAGMIGFPLCKCHRFRPDDEEDEEQHAGACYHHYDPEAPIETMKLSQVEGM